MAGLPLEGYRAVNLGHVWAAPLLGHLLADFGAEVIKVESKRHLDTFRTWPTVTGQKDIDLSYIFLPTNRSVLGIAVDFTKPKGVELVKSLVAKSDVVIENFPPRILPAYGLDYPHLREVKPDIIMISLPSAGQYGPLRDVKTFGPTLSGLVGMTSLLGYPDPEGPQVCAETGYADPMAAASGAFSSWPRCDTAS